MSWRPAAGRKLCIPSISPASSSELASDDAIFTCDVGLPTVWAARYLAMNGKRRLVGSFWHGSMANAMPQAIGAQAALPGRQVISLSGDGGFTMLMGDLLTFRQRKLAMKIVVFNNGALGFVELEKKATGFINTGTELENPDFALMAEAIGIKGVRIEDPAEVEWQTRGGAGASWAGGGGCRRQPEELAHAPDHQRADGEGLHDVYDQRGAERARGRGRRTGEDKSASVGRRGWKVSWHDQPLSRRSRHP